MQDYPNNIDHDYRLAEDDARQKRIALDRTANAMAGGIGTPEDLAIKRRVFEEAEARRKRLEPRWRAQLAAKDTRGEPVNERLASLRAATARTAHAREEEQAIARNLARDVKGEIDRLALELDNAGVTYQRQLRMAAASGQGAQLIPHPRHAIEERIAKLKEQQAGLEGAHRTAQRVATDAATAERRAETAAASAIAYIAIKRIHEALAAAVADGAFADCLNATAFQEPGTTELPDAARARQDFGLTVVPSGDHFQITFRPSAWPATAPRPREWLEGKLQ